VYLKAIKRLGLYICTNYKNGSDLQMCVDAEDLILPEEPIILDNPMPQHEKVGPESSYSD